MTTGKVDGGDAAPTGDIFAGTQTQQLTRPMFIFHNILHATFAHGNFFDNVPIKDLKNHH